MSTTYLLLLLLAIAIILSLAGYAGYLLWQVKQQQKHKQNLLNKQNKKHLTSISIILEAMQAEQCDLSEGCWRLSVLLGNVHIDECDFPQKYPAIFALYEHIKHMPILEARKALDKKERMKLDFERMKHEAELQEQIHQNIKQLSQHTKTLLNSLS